MKSHPHLDRISGLVPVLERYVEVISYDAHWKTVDLAAEAIWALELSPLAVVAEVHVISVSVHVASDLVEVP